uniref:Uncharacterized protein n=1 Tax=Arundo donax TaxID=35708 RepID=A0A0A8ZZ88_ARUDO
MSFVLTMFNYSNVHKLFHLPRIVLL